MWILGGEFFFWSKAVDPRRKPRVYCLAPEKNPPLISTTRGGGVQEGQQHLHQVVVPQELFHWVILPLEEFLDMVVFS